MEISIYALVGNHGAKIIRLPGMIKRKKVSRLIDCGSSHSIIDEYLAQSLNCRLQQAKPILLTIAREKNWPEKPFVIH